MKTKCRKHKWPAWQTKVLAAAFWLAVWQFAAVLVGQEFLLASPLQTALRLFQMAGTVAFWERIGFSALRILSGFLLAVIVGFLLAVAAHLSEAADALISPLMHFVKATPVASFIILALVWVKGSSLSVLVSFLMVLPILYTAILTGIEATDSKLLEMAAVFHLPLAARLRAIWLPGVFPAFCRGCSAGIGIAWKSGVAAEVIGLPDGSIGDALYRAKLTLSTGDLFAWTLVIICLSAALEKLILCGVAHLERRLSGGELTKTWVWKSANFQKATEKKCCSVIFH